MIKKESCEEDFNDLYKEISIALNRQKAINEADIRYTDSLINDINDISEAKDKPFFKIHKRSSEISSGEYKIEDFVKITAIYLLQEPGSARSSKGKYLKSDLYWDRLKLSENEVLDEDAFLKKFKPFVAIKEFFDFLGEVKDSKDNDNEIIKCVDKYGNELLCSYIAWVACEGNDDFSRFPSEIKKDKKLVISIKKRIAKIIEATCNQQTVDSNYFKKDKTYIELRKELDKDDKLKNEIKKLFKVDE